MPYWFTRKVFSDSGEVQSLEFSYVRIGGGVVDEDVDRSKHLHSAIDAVRCLVGLSGVRRDARHPTGESCFVCLLDDDVEVDLLP